MKWSRWTLGLDGGALLLLGVSQLVLVDQSYTAGTGVLGRAYLRSPYVNSMVGLLAVIIVIAACLLAAAFSARDGLWHVLGLLTHAGLAVVDLTTMSFARQLFGDVTTVYFELVLHALFITAHVVGITQQRRQAHV